MRLYGSLMDLKSLHGIYEDVESVFVQIDWLTWDCIMPINLRNRE